jgi:phosphoglycolate phosphatase-like HAD superfamily hydrolase
MDAAAAAPLRGVVFDMDGTLTVPNMDFTAMYARAGVPLGDDILSDKWRADKHACAVVEETEAESRRTMRLMPGVAELAAWLGAHNIPMALVTRNSARAIEHFHSSCWPAGVPPMDPAISRDDPLPSKPDPAAMVAIQSRWAIADAPSLLMVGDSPSNDIMFGQAAGVRTALLDTGRRLAERGKTNVDCADIVVENLSQLAAEIWSKFIISSKLTDAALHAKR